MRSDLDSTRYPQYARLQLIPESERNAIGAFLEWLASQGYTICQWREAGDNGQPARIAATAAQLDEEDRIHGLTGRLIMEHDGVPNPRHDSWPAAFYPIGTDPEFWLALYYQIDRQQLAEEKERLLREDLAALRAAHNPAHGST